MLDKKILEATREALIKYKEKTNFVDKDIPKYISGIMGALNGFVSDGMALSAEERLAYVQREIDKPNGIYEKLETGSNKKRTWSCIFALAALALQRQQSLPPNSPELEGLDQLLDTLSNGWVNSFTSWGIPKTDIIEGIKQGLSLWIDRFDVEHQDAKSTMETLLYFYTIVCSLEKTIQGSRLVPADISVLLSTLKAKVEEKYNSLQKIVGQEAQKDAVIAVAEPITKDKHSDKKDARDRKARDSEKETSAAEPLVIALRESVMQLKQRQQETLIACEAFDIDLCEGLKELDSIVKDNDLDLKQFWQHYNTPEKFELLMHDLQLNDKDEAAWRLYYDYQNGTYLRQAVAAVWTGRWGVPEILGGVSAKALSLEKIREKLKEAVASISGQFTTTEHGVPTSANIETLHATVLDAGKRATEALVLVTDLEKALDSVRLYTFSLGDSQKRISEQLALLDELLPKSPTFDQLRNLHRTISREINNAKTMISKQQEVVKQLSQIQNQIAEISAQGVDTKEFRFAFETMVDEVFQRTIVNQELGVLADAPTTKSKIEYLQTTLGNLYQSIEDQEQIIQQSKALNELDKEIAELTNLSVKSMSQLMEDRQNLSATLYTPDDDKDAKTRIDEMLRDIDSVEAIVLAQMQLILKLETTLINIRQLKAKGLEVNDLEAKLKTLVDVLFQKTIIDQELLPQEIGDKIQGPYEKIERIKKAFSAVIQTTDQIKRDEVRLVNDVMNDMEHALAHATRYVEKHKNSFVHKLLCKLSSPYRSTFELLEKAIGAKDESLEKGFQYISEALDIKQGKTMTTIMRHSLKGIKKFADGVLASQTYLDHHNTSEDQDCSDDQANQVRI